MNKRTQIIQFRADEETYRRAQKRVKDGGLQLPDVMRAALRSVADAAPSITKQGDGFRPTYIDQTGGLIQGDTVDFAELNYIFNDLYAKAAHIDQLLTAKGK
ncbi:TPA: hypothetical protein N3A25_003363 [Salmonella enterica subsp. diarizonae serovar 65:z10:e,n,x,z15]|nr:hypothetical protein [Salmonella enterica subsp. diarizonae serovar 65:z10:e,n,x,z15]